MTKHIQWNGTLSQEGYDILKGEGGCIVCPTKVGYIIMTSDKAGLERKFEAKERNRNKPGVVLCGSMDELRALAQLNPEIEAFYQKHWDEDILLGCILPWKPEAFEKLKAYGDGREELMTDVRGTSCFVIKFGKAGEQLAAKLWEEGKMVYASSANPSGKGNRGKVEGIGERIEGAVDLVIEADDYVASIQPDKTIETRYEQGVMVSMVTWGTNPAMGVDFDSRFPEIKDMNDERAYNYMDLEPGQKPADIDKGFPIRHSLFKVLWNTFPSLEIVIGDLVRIHDSHLRSKLDGHIADGHSLFHAQCINSLSTIFHHVANAASNAVLGNQG